MKNYLDWDKMCKPFLNKFDLVLPKPVLALSLISFHFIPPWARNDFNDV